MKLRRDKPVEVSQDTSASSTDVPSGTSALPSTMDQLNARVTELRREHMQLSKEILLLERNGVSVPDLDPAPSAAALAVLQGDDLSVLAPTLSTPQARLRSCLLRRDILTEALRLADDLSTRLAANEAGERITAHKEEYRAAVRGKALALLNLEAAEQELDRLRKVIKPFAPMEFDRWHLAGGRFADRGSMYRFVQLARDQGIITDKEFTEALRQADERRK